MSADKPQMGLPTLMDQNGAKDDSTRDGTKEERNSGPPGIPILEQLNNETNPEDPATPLVTEISTSPFFHGSIGAEDVPECLKEDGDFLLRTPIEATAVSKVVTAVFWSGKIRELPIYLFKEDGITQVFFTKNLIKGSIKDLVAEHMMNGVPLDGEVYLKRPVSRSKWQLPPNSVVLEEKLGEGAFGAVYKGKLKEAGGERMVAVKVTKECDEHRKNELLLEARVMRQFHCNQVVKFFGLMVDQDKVMIVMELIEGGSLNHYLKNNANKISVANKSSFCLDVARGLAYLHKQHFLHRDVASRNCLIDAATKKVKISDFGMSKQGETYKIMATERTPIRWQAPEVLKTATYSIKCDVYSFGMVTYEVFSDGKVPFEGTDNKIIRQKVSYQPVLCRIALLRHSGFGILAGLEVSTLGATAKDGEIHEPTYRPPIGSDWPTEIKAILAYCWHANPVKRPTMNVIVGVLQKIFVRKAGSKEMIKSNGKLDKSTERKVETPVKKQGKGFGTALMDSIRNKTKKSNSKGGCFKKTG